MRRVHEQVTLVRLEVKRQIDDGHVQLVGEAPERGLVAKEHVAREAIGGIELGQAFDLIIGE